MCQYMKIILIPPWYSQWPVSVRKAVFNINADICLGAKNKYLPKTFTLYLPTLSLFNVWPIYLIPFSERASGTHCGKKKDLLTFLLHTGGISCSSSQSTRCLMDCVGEIVFIKSNMNFDFKEDQRAEKISGWCTLTEFVKL